MEGQRRLRDDSVRWSPPTQELTLQDKSIESWHSTMHQVAYSKRSISPSFLQSNGQDNKAVVALKGRCQALCLNLRGIIQENHKNVLAISTASCSTAGNFTSKCTVGIMLHGTKIENTLFGGPAFGHLCKGDILIRIDGQSVNEENILTALRGCDIPGSKVVMTVQRQKGETPSYRRGVTPSTSPSPDCSIDEEDLEEIDITITRIATAEIADRRRMFDLFTFLEARAVANEDQEAAAKVNETIELWTKMWMADSDRYNEMRTQLETMQTSCESCVVELMDCLDKLFGSLSSQADTFLTNSSSFATQTRTAMKEERKQVLQHLDALQRDVDAINANRLQLLLQIKGLQDSRRELKSQIEQMVPRSEFLAIQQQLAARNDQLRAAEAEGARLREAVDGLNLRVADMQNDKAKQLSTIQGMVPRSQLHDAWNETARVVEQLMEIKSKSKLWTTETRILAQTEVKILLTKIDAVARDLSQVEAAHAASHLNLHHLHAHRKTLSSQINNMVPAAELDAERDRAAELAEQAEQLRQLVRTRDAEIEQLKTRIQGMVARTDLLAAQSEAMSAKEEVAARQKDLKWKEELLVKAQEQLLAARDESSRLEGRMAGMVARADLEAARAQLQASEEASKAERQKLRDAMTLLNDRVSSLETEKDSLDSQLKGKVARTELLSAQAEAKSAQEDAEAKAREILRLQGLLSQAQERVDALRAEAAQLQSAMGGMVTKAELEAVKAQLRDAEAAARTEAARHKEAVDALAGRIKAADAEKATLTSTIQGMVARSELLAAQSEVKKAKEEAAARAKEVEWKEEQLGKAQKQVDAARVEAAELQAKASGMVDRSELEAARVQLKVAADASRAEAQKHRDALVALQEQLAKQEEEKNGLQTAMQKMSPSSVLLAARSENALLAEKLADFRSKAKLWCTQVRVAAQTEIKILLTKVDAVSHQMAQLERANAASQKAIQALQAGQAQLEAQLKFMVQPAELQASRAEAANAREALEGLRIQLRGKEEELQKLASDVQGMVTRAELLSAQSDVKAAKEDAAAKMKDLEWKEKQLRKSEEQVQAARVEAAELQAKMSSMAARSELEAVRAHLEAAEAAAAATAQKHKEAMGALNERIKTADEEKSKLLAKIQEMVPKSELSTARNESAQLKEGIHELKAKAKTWAAPTKISVHAEIKILLTKVDGVYNQIAQLESSYAESQRHIKALQARKTELQGQIGAMIPMSDLQAAKAESAKLREMIDGLRQQLRGKDEEIDKLSTSLQGMVSRTDLLAARSDATAAQEEASARAKDLKRMQAQLVSAQEQLSAARLDSSQKEAQLNSMVPRGDLELSKTQLREVEEAGKQEAQRLRDAIAALNQRLAAAEHAKHELMGTLQTMTPAVNLLAAKKENTQLLEKFSELQNKVKFWISQTKMAAESEVKIMLTKADALQTQLSQLQTTQARAQKDAEALCSINRDLKARVGDMVPAQELAAARDELAASQLSLGELRERIRGLQEEVERLKQAAQAMVPRAQLLAAQSEALAAKEEAAALVKDVAWREGQLEQTKKQVQAARQECEQLQVTMAGMAPKSELFVHKAESDKLRDSVAELQEALRKLEDDKAGLLNTMQGMTPKTEFASARTQAMDAAEKLQDVQAKARLWASKTRHTARAEVALLVSKVDALEGLLGHMELRHAEAHQEMQNLHAKKKTLSAAMGSMVPLADLQDCQEQEARQREVAEDLAKRLQLKQEEAAALAAQLQGMVAKSELLAAQSEAKVVKEESAALVKEVELRKGQLAKAQEQLQAVQDEVSKLEGRLAGMVSKADLEAARALVREAEAAAQAERERERQAAAGLHERVAGLEKDNDALRVKVQSMVARTDLLEAQAEAARQREDSEAKAAEVQRLQELLKAARAEAAQLQREMAERVPKADVEAMRGELRERDKAARSDGQSQKEALAALQERLRALEAANDALTSQAKGMVPRAELQAAQAEAKSQRDGCQDLSKELEHAQAQLSAARLEVAQVRADMGAMVPRSALVAARAQADENEAAARAEVHKQREAAQVLQERVGALEEEKSRLVTAMQSMCPRLEMHAARKETALLKDRLVDLQAKAKQLATQTRIAAKGEVKILLTKVDAVEGQLAQLESSHTDVQRHIKGLHAGRRELQAQMGGMVSAAELQASRAEAGRLREVLEDLRQQLRARQDDVDQLKADMQGKVDRADLLAAQSEAKAAKEEVAARAGDVARIQGQLHAARLQAAELESAMGGMVPRGELDAARALIKVAEDAGRAEEARHREAAGAWNERAKALEDDKHKMAVTMQAMVPRSEVHAARHEVAVLRESLQDLRAKARQWAVQTGIAARAETKILLTKAEGLANQLAQLEARDAEVKRHVKALLADRRELQAQLADMVPAEEVEAWQARTAKLREGMDELRQELRSRDADIEQKNATIQAMVSRGELLDAQSEAKAAKEEAAARAKEVEWKEEQLGKAQAQAQASRLEAARLESAMAAMVPRGDVEALKAQLKAAEAAARTEGQAHREAVAGLNERILALEKDKSGLILKMQDMELRSELHHARHEASQTKEQLHDVRAKLRLWANQTRVSSRTDARILLTKLDAAEAQLAVLEAAQAQARAHTLALDERRRQLEARLAAMAPAADLEAARAEAAAARAAAEELRRRLREKEGEADALRADKLGMVPRGDLLAAQAQSKAREEEAAARAAELARLEAALGRARDQLTAARGEADRLQAELGEMLPRAELAAAREELARQRDAAGLLQESLRAAEGERSRLKDSIQAMVPAADLEAARRELAETAAALEELRARSKAWTAATQAEVRDTTAALRAQADGLQAQLDEAARAREALQQENLQLCEGRRGALRRLEVAVSSRKEALAAAAVRRMRGEGLMGAWARWRAEAADARRLEVVKERLGARLGGRSLAQAWSDWRGAVRSGKRERRAVSWAGARAWTGMREAVRHWRSLAAQAAWTEMVVTTRAHIAEGAARAQCKALLRACLAWNECKDLRSEDSSALSRSQLHSKFVAC